MTHLNSYSLSNETFWLAHAEATREQQEAGSYFGQSWPQELRDEVFNRAIVTILAKETSEQLFLQSAAVLSSIIPHGVKMTNEQNDQLTNVIQDILNVSLKNLEDVTEFVEIHSALVSFAGPVLPKVSWSYNLFNLSNTPGVYQKFILANQLIITLNLIGSLDLGKKFHSELQALHDDVISNLTPSIFSNIAVTEFNTSNWNRGVVGNVQIVYGRDWKKVLVKEAVYYQTGLLLGQDYQDLQGLTARKDAQLAQEEKARRRKTAAPGDTLAVYVQGITTENNSGPPIYQAGTNAPVWGYPTVVSPEGEISLLMLEPLPVSGKTLSEIRDLIRKSYVDHEILRQETDTLKVNIQVNMLLKLRDQLEVRRISGPKPK